MRLELAHDLLEEGTAFGVKFGALHQRFVDMGGAAIARGLTGADHPDDDGDHEGNAHDDEDFGQLHDFQVATLAGEMVGAEHGADEGVAPARFAESRQKPARVPSEPPASAC